MRRAKCSGAAAENEDDFQVGVARHKGRRNVITPQEDLSFVLPALRLYTFLRCFTMCDIITRRPDEL